MSSVSAWSTAAAHLGSNDFIADSDYIRIFLDYCVVELLKWVTIFVMLLLVCHKNPRIKSESNEITASPLRRRTPYMSLPSFLPWRDFLES